MGSSDTYERSHDMSKISTSILALSALSEMERVPLPKHTTQEHTIYMDGYIKGVFSFAALLEEALERADTSTV